MTGPQAHAHVDVAAPPGRVWEALTDPPQVSAWMGGARVETTWEPGSPITWSGEWEGRPYADRGEVLEVEPGRRLVVTHYSPLSGQDDVPESYHTVRYELSGDDGGTAVDLAQDGCADADEAARFSQTWQMMLDGLKQVAEGR
jgi:uncharacterized protein YndB with AHSA1/START domain